MTLVFVSVSDHLSFPLWLEVVFFHPFYGWVALPLETAMAPPPALLPRKSHGRRSLVGCSPWGRWESGTTERLHFHFSLSCTGEGNGSPLQCSCLENPRDGGAWWAAVSGVTQSRTRLKRLSSSSSTALGMRAPSSLPLHLTFYTEVSFVSWILYLVLP